MQLGKFKIDILDTGIFALDGGAMFGVVPKALWAKAYNPGDELNRIPLAAKPLLIQWDNKKLLIDTGCGDKVNEKLASIYKIDVNSSSIEKALAKFAIKREEITDVILTHFHFDHAGGATIIENNEIIPTFPNAKYYVQAEHLKWSLSPTDKDKASFLKENYMPLINNNLIESLDGACEVFPGISVQPLYGHTKGMQIVKINDGGLSLVYFADLMPTAAHLPIPFVMGYDNFPLTTMAEKKSVLGEAYESSSILVFEHDAFLQAASITTNEKGFVIDKKIVISE